MKFDIVAYTDISSANYKENEDCILVNGNLLTEGNIVLQNQENSICFVSDGVGGVKGGNFASYFILSKISQFENLLDKSSLREYLYSINEELIETSKKDSNIRGCAATLSGIILINNHCDIIHVGDSEIWLLRNGMFFKISTDEVLDPDNVNSPIVNYFGGDKNILKFHEFSFNFNVGDVLLLCSDGLFKTVKVKPIKEIILNNYNLSDKISQIKTLVMQNNPQDNVSVILVYIKN